MSDASIDTQIAEFTHVRDAINTKLDSLNVKRSGQFVGHRQWAKGVVNGRK